MNFRSISESVVWSVGNAATSQAISLLAFLITARLISPAAFGIVAIATLTVEVMKRVLVEPLAAGLMASHQPDEQKFNRCFSAIVTLSGAGSIMVFLAAYPIEWLIGAPSQATVLQLMSTMLLGSGLSRTHEVWYSKRFEFRLLAIRSSAAAICGAVTGVSMALLGFGIWSLVAQQIVNTAVAFLLLFTFSKWRPKLDISLRRSFGQLSAASHLIITSVAGFIGGEADVFFVTAYLGAGAGGIYSAAKRLIMAASMIVINSVQNVILVGFAAKSRTPEAYRLHLDSLRIFALIITPMYVGLSVLAFDVVALLLDEKWSRSGGILSVLAVAALGQGLTWLETNYLLAAGADWSRTKVIVVTAVITVLALPFLAPHGMLAVAYGMAAINWVSLFCTGAAAALNANERLTGPFIVLSLPAIGAGSMFVASSFIDPSWSPAWCLLLWPPGLLLVYVGTVCFVGFPVLKNLAAVVRMAPQD